MATKIVSFGYRHGRPPKDVQAIDVRGLFRNPFRERSLRNLPGTDPLIGAYMTGDPHFRDSYGLIQRAMTGCEGECWIGCTGGKHRSVYLAERIGREKGIPVEHRDVEKGENYHGD